MSEMKVVEDTRPKQRGIKFECDGVKYELEFVRYFGKVRVGVNAKTGTEIWAPRSDKPFTTAIVWKEGEPLPFRSYTVGCHKSDHFTKEDGRMAALRMLTSGKVEKGKGELRGDQWEYRFREALWQAYLHRPRPKAKESKS